MQVPREQIAAGQGWRGGTPSRTSISFLWEWPGKELFSKSLPMEGLFAYDDDARKDAFFPWVL